MTSPLKLELLSYSRNTFMIYLWKICLLPTSSSKQEIRHSDEYKKKIQ